MLGWKVPFESGREKEAVYAVIGCGAKGLTGQQRGMVSSGLGRGGVERQEVG